MFLIYGGDSELIVSGYTDTSFQTDHNYLKLQLKFVFILNGGVVSSKSSKYKITMDSTIDAEYIATSKAAKKFV